MPTVVRRFERRDRDQLTELINLHVAAVIPGVVLSVNTVLSQLEREPGETIVDPWVAERCCLVAEAEHRILAAALLHRFRTDSDVGASYRGVGDMRWLVSQPAAIPAGHALVAAAMDQMHRWGVTAIGADCALPAPGCYGIPDTAPHLQALLRQAGFGEPTRRELVLAARCDDLLGADLDGATVVRTVATLGTRFTLSVDDDVRPARVPHRASPRRLPDPRPQRPRLPTNSVDFAVGRCRVTDRWQHRAMHRTEPNRTEEGPT